MTIQELDRAYIKPTNDIMTALTMVARLTKDHEEMIQQGRETIKAADQNQDPVTADLVTRTLGEIEKMAWMLRATKHDTEL